MKTAVQCEASDLVRALQDMADRTTPSTVSKAADLLGLSIITLLRPQHELVCEVLRDVRDTLLRSTGDDEEDYCRGVCDACNDSIQRLYMRLPARPTPLPPLHGRCYGKRVPRTELAKIRERKPK
jgi:hypothetical protein